VNMLKSVWNPILPKSVSRCDDRTASQDSGNRAEDSVPIQTLQSHLTPLCAGPHGYENLWIVMALYLVGRPRLKGGVNVVQFWMRTCLLEGDCLIGAIFRTISCVIVRCVFFCDFFMRRFLLVSSLFELK